MANIVDIIDGAAVESTLEGFKAERVFFLTELGGSNTGRLYQALIAQGIPRVGDPHPDIPGIKVLSVKSEPLERQPNQARVQVTYGVEETKTDPESEANGITSIEVDATALAEETQVDINGEFMVNKYTSWQTGGSFLQACIPVRVSVYRPQMTVRIKQKAQSLPKAKIQQYLGTVNADPWSGYPAGTWLCTALNASFSKGRWDIDYNFIYRENGWQVVDLIQINGRIPEDVSEGNGIARFNVYRAVPWSQIGVRW